MDLDTNQNDNFNGSNVLGKGCHVCPHAQYAPAIRCDGFGLNELKVESLDKNVCLCEVYNGGCKLCTRPSLAPTLSLGLEAGCGCNGNCGNPYSSKYKI